MIVELYSFSIFFNFVQNQVIYFRSNVNEIHVKDLTLINFTYLKSFRTQKQTFYHETSNIIIKLVKPSRKDSSRFSLI